jgi:threonine dehydrogenase-like Zn-dependent dehydrogenase
MAGIHGAGLSIATDLSDRRLEKAKELYADVGINASQTPVEERVRTVRELTEGVGPDLVIESAGVPGAFIEALEMVRKGGTVIEVGNWVDTGQTVPLNVMQHVASKNVHIHSVFHCGSDWGPVLRVMGRHADRFPFASLISHRMGLDELVADMSVVVDPEACMKVQVVPHKEEG